MKKKAPTRKELSKKTISKPTSPKKTTKSSTGKTKSKQITKQTTSLKEDLITSHQETASINTEPFSKKEPSISTVKEKTKKIRNTRNIFQLYFAGWKNIFRFKGRANRSEFISFWSLSIPLFFLCNPAFDDKILDTIMIILSSVIMLALFTLTIRRFHDLGENGFWGGLIFILVFAAFNILAPTNPLLSVLYIISVFLYFIFSLLPGEQKNSKYGNPPKPTSRIALIFVLIFSTILIHSGSNLALTLYKLIPLL
jgi:uncharacterized membrane protein YhaH (DUF805 family)